MFRMNINACTQILAVLARRTSRVSFIELARRIPDCDHLRIFPQLHDLDGVVFILKEPEGLTLTSELREELAPLLPELASDPAPDEEPSTRQPHAVLEISATATELEAARAHRRRLQECHPRKFSGMGPELQQLAVERGAAVNSAYEAFLAQNRAKNPPPEVSSAQDVWEKSQRSG